MQKRALYREYRPTRFSEVIGQDHITTILKHQVMEGKVSHAYLFCGSRGTGKTTSAKILSRAVNCLHPDGGEPCGSCEACRISKSGGVDIVEIDAASNNGVDNVRDLIEQVRFAPMELKHRVFIIDEVHMLTGSAFNALLKTLEEPPSHVMFILATTEPQKLPATIISRCQRFDFHRLSIAHIVCNLQSVLEKAGASVEPDGLRLIARAANGGMRDALSLLDQCLSFCGDRVTKKDVCDVLGSVEEETLAWMAHALFHSDAEKCLTLLNDMINNGRDLTVFSADLGQYLRELLIAKTCGNAQDLLDCTEDRIQLMHRAAKDVDEARILYALEQVLKAQSTLRYLPSPRLLLETTLIRICNPIDDKTAEALAARVAALEQNGVRPMQTEPSVAAPAATSRTLHTDPVPPWDDAPPVMEAPPEEYVPNWEPAAAPPKPESKPEPKPEPTPEPKPEPTPEPKQEQSDGRNEATAIWEEAKRAMQRLNPMVYFAAKTGRPVSLTGDTLTVEYSVGDNNFGMLSAAVNLKVAETAIRTVRADTILLLKQQKPNAEEERLHQMFGNALTIEE